MFRIVTHSPSVVGIALLLVSAPLEAIDRITVAIADIAGAGITAQGIDAQLALPGTDSTTVTVNIARLSLGAGIGEFRNVQILCPSPIVKEPDFGCPRAQVRGRSLRFGAQALSASVHWNSKLRELRFAAVSSVGGGEVRAQGNWNARRWSVNLQATAIGIAAAQGLLKPWYSLPPDWKLSGRIDSMSLRAAGDPALNRIELHAAVTSVNFGNGDGSIAGDEIRAAATLQAMQAAGQWQIKTGLQSGHGEVLLGRGYWNFTSQPAHVDGAGTFSDAHGINVQAASAHLGQFADLSGTALIDLKSATWVRSARLELSDMDLAALPAQTRDGLLAGTPVPHLQGLGHMSGRIDVQAGAPPAADLNVRNVSLDDSGAKLAVHGLSGRVRWSAARESSDLAWNEATLYGLALGAAHLKFAMTNNAFALLEAARIPILDGALDIRTLQLQGVGEPTLSARFDASIEPIAVASLCKAFGWPEFSGTLSGSIPNLALQNGELTLGGNLEARVFNGLIAVGELRLSDPFGARPRLRANLRMTGLDLAAITGAFSIGKITGRLSGQIDALDLVGWEPVAFDARFFTPAGDRSTRRISQRAVENISSIGGASGAAAVLQRGALSLLKEFNYARLGISCKLVNDVCLMDGIEPDLDGYNLVKGSGLPRIDVIGDAHRVNWPQLENSLKALPQSAPTLGKP